jgi:hypothetical protein
MRGYEEDKINDDLVASGFSVAEFEMHTYDQHGVLMPTKETERVLFPRKGEVMTGRRWYLTSLTLFPRRENTNMLTMNRHISVRGPVMGLNLLSVVACRVIMLGSGKQSVGEVGYVGLAFARRFAGHWPTTRWTNWCWRLGGDCHIQFHVRYLNMTSAHDDSDGLPFGGLLVQRERRIVSGPSSSHGEEEKKDEKKVFLVETRASTAVITTTDAACPPYTIVTLTDSKPSSSGRGQPWDKFGTRARDAVQNEIDLHECGTFRGVAMFQIEVYQMLRTWSQEWSWALDQMDALINVKVRVVYPSILRW